MRMAPLADPPLRIEVLPAAFVDGSLAAEIVRLCEEAYEEPIGGTLAAFESPVHVLGFLGNELASHALWIPRPLRHGRKKLQSAYVEAVATRPRLQGRGYASAVMRAVAGHITGFDIGALSPFDMRYYERLGWETWRGPLLVAMEGGEAPTPDEEVMILRFPHTPLLDLDGPLAAPWRPGEIW